VIVPATRLVPSGASDPIEIEDYTWSPDHSRLLVYTNTARVWRQNTRGDYWVLDLSPSSGRLRKLGGPDAKPSTLMFAKFSPDGLRVAYVREHDLYAESLADGHITPLTHDGSVTTINGTFDWVYEEELDDRDGFRWSPDGKRIAYWQLDAKGVRDFLLIDNTDSLYSFVKPVQYPKAGTTNSAARIGVVSASGGPTTWLEIPGDPRNNYLARMDWEPGTNDVLVQQLNRRQTQNTFYVANATTGGAKPLFVDRDSAWIDVYSDATGPSVDWLADNSGFVFLSERDGWRHAYLVSKTGAMRLISPGEFDVMKIEYVDTRGGWLYYDASPANATQMFLWRTKLDGSGHPERLTPPAARGMHSYDIAPGAHWAIHTYSTFGTPPVTDLVRLPSHEVVRILESNADVASRIASLRRGAVAFSQIDIGGGVKLDSWMMKPADFDSTKKYPVLFYVYGEPASQTVLDAYGGSTYLWHLMLTQRGYIVASVDNRGTPGRADASGARSCATRSDRFVCASSRPPRRSSAGCRTSTRPASRCGAGAAAGRRPCTSCSARPRSIAPAWRWRRWPTSTTTTPFIRSATSACPAPTSRRTTTRHRSTMRTACAATCSSSTAPVTTTCTIRAPSS
jgi:dipeptidyl-peptidase-4